MADDRWNESWKITADIDSVLVFSIIVTNKRPHLIIWNEKDKKATLLDLNVPREVYFKQAEEQKVKRCKDLIEECKKQEWKTNLAVVVSEKKVFLIELKDVLATARKK